MEVGGNNEGSVLELTSNPEAERLKLYEQVRSLEKSDPNRKNAEIALIALKDGALESLNKWLIVNSDEFKKLNQQKIKAAKKFNKDLLNNSYEAARNVPGYLNWRRASKSAIKKAPSGDILEISGWATGHINDYDWEGGFKNRESGKTILRRIVNGVVKETFVITPTTSNNGNKDWTFRHYQGESLSHSLRKPGNLLESKNVDYIGGAPEGNRNASPVKIQIRSGHDPIGALNMFVADLIASSRIRDQKKMRESGQQVAKATAA